MPPYLIVLAILFYLPAWNDKFVLGSDSIADRPTIPTANSFTVSNDHSRRRLRSSKKTGEFRSESSDAEEKTLVSWAKNKIWLKTGKSEEYVANKLGLKDLTKEAQKVHSNNKRFQKFLYGREGLELDDIVKRGASKDKMWRQYGLDDVPLEELTKNEGFKTYVRFMARYDASIYSQYKEGIMKNIWWEYQYLSPGQHYANILVWAKANRSTKYVKKALGLDHSGWNYKYYEEFLRLTEKNRWFKRKTLD
ncbi:Secreted RxLR effector peptide protein [Phytophthora palmivora]|uniref:Secreted RxLR effector peptide protein n=1 Tax=Phytophthora palmivora TaxID=4796 RepID=A0A2P4XJX8_9STRA|nr:Secreted RxLR effector peptide protein [Phytophthora palmivora]